MHVLNYSVPQISEGVLYVNAFLFCGVMPFLTLLYAIVSNAGSKNPW